MFKVTMSAAYDTEIMTNDARVLKVKNFNVRRFDFGVANGTVEKCWDERSEERPEFRMTIPDGIWWQYCQTVLPYPMVPFIEDEF